MILHRNHLHADLPPVRPHPGEWSSPVERAVFGLNLDAAFLVRCDAVGCVFGEVYIFDAGRIAERKRCAKCDGTGMVRPSEWA